MESRLEKLLSLKPLEVCIVSASAVILAGGKSSRMGFNKAFAELNHKRIIEIQLEELSNYFSEVIIVSNDPDLYSYTGVKIVSDIIPGRGPLSGIHSGLIECNHEDCFIIPCDMPFISGEIGYRLIELARGFDGAVPQLNGKLEPLSAIYKKSCIPAIEDCLIKDKRKIIEFYPFVDLRFVEVNQLFEGTAKVFSNLNTPADLVEARLHVEMNNTVFNTC